MHEGVYELHWQRRERGQLHCQLYGLDQDGQRRLVTTVEQAPFESDFETVRDMLRLLALDLRRRPT